MFSGQAKPRLLPPPRAAGDLHHQALRALGNRLVGYLHGCLRTRRPYDEATAWAHRHDREQLAA